VPEVDVTADIGDLARAELVFLAVPSNHVAAVCNQLCDVVDGSHLLVHVSRGLIGEHLGTLSALIRETTPVRRVGVLAGPLVATALAQGQPGGGIVGSLFPEVADAVREAIGGPRLRIYATEDVVGVEVASAFVGLIALALGYAKHAGFGPGTLAVLATRAMAEAARVGLHRRGSERTFAGLAGYGDLIAAVADDQRPELAVGEAMAKGLTAEAAMRQVGAHIEGLALAGQVVAFAERQRIEVPIAGALARLFAGKLTATEVVTKLMTRPVGFE
jgi:glycerol-3-phosphate dehydrogenase (NAD(P)+)